MSYYWTNFGTYKQPADTIITGLDPAFTSHNILQDIGVNTHANIDTHISSQSNPHGSSLSQTTLNVGTINKLSPANEITINDPIISTNLTTNNIPDNVVTTSSSGSDHTLTKTPIANFLTNNAVATLTNKTIDSANNTLQVNGVNINSLINQDVRDTASPIFATIGVPSIQNGGNIVIPSGGGTFAKTTDIQTLINKTIDSASNTLLLNGNNINDLINQDVRNTASPTFASINIPTITNTGTLTLPTTTGTLALTSDLANYVTVNTIQNINAKKTFNANPEIAAVITGGSNTVTFPIGTTTLVGKDTVDVLVNKEIDSDSNVISITSSPLVATDINNLINQDVRTTASPTFLSATTTADLNIGTYRYSNTADKQFYDIIQSSSLPLVYRSVVKQTIPASTSNVVLWTYNYPTNYALTVDFYGIGFSGANNGCGAYHYANVFRQVSGVITNAGTLYTDKREQGANGYGGKLSFTFNVSGSNLQLLVSNSAAYSIIVTGNITQTMAN